MKFVDLLELGGVQTPKIPPSYGPVIIIIIIIIIIGGIWFFDCL